MLTDIFLCVCVLKKDDIFIDWSSWSVVGPIVVSKHWFEYGLSSNQIRTNTVRNVVLLVVDSSSIHHYIFWSDQCYHRVHMMVEVQWYGNFDEWLLSPSAAFCLPHDSCWTSTYYWKLWKQCLRVPFMKLMLGWKKWLPQIHVHLEQVAAISSRKLVSAPSGIIPC